ncbi:protocadherin alpha-C2-like isoform X2 [Paramormyrops kingsleyae]|uniref:protocadherin alpha-C2-like isoform X2 n=1 Tax=Paramormyrops kingsleyae TaxID=1676925 RepID=UPI003B97AD9B
MTVEDCTFAFGAQITTMIPIFGLLLRKRYVSSFLIFCVTWRVALSVTRYSVPEEMEEESIVTNLATDLAIDVHSLNDREVKLDIIHSKKYLDINKDTGELYIVEKIDREYLCSAKSACFLKMDVIIENPLRIFNIELEIKDINDNAPNFRREKIQLDILESVSPGERFSLTNAVDPDVGTNSIRTYYLRENEHFDLEIQTGSDGTKYAGLVLKKSLDREERAVHNLLLTAVDGGVPVRSGTASIIVRVLDVNDNAPRFDRETYTVNITENAPIGTLVIKLNATDLDDGTNAEIAYAYTLYTFEKTQEMFSLDSNTGEINVKDVIDFEKIKSFEMHIQAKDKALSPLSGQCEVKVFVTDLNDNYPEITIQSFKSAIKENAAIGTVIALISISDRDSGDNGKVDLSMNQHLPFTLNKSSESHFTLAVSEPLDREKVPEYEITFIVTDRGSPPLSNNETITLELLDVNDNAPVFPQSFYTIPVMENNAPGAMLSSVAAYDPDLHENQYLVYFITEKEIANTSVSMLFSINPENGNLYALKTFDYEREKEFLFHVEARDSGVPPLSSNVTVHIVILDQNDNSPVIVSPWHTQGSMAEEVIPRYTEKGSLVAKVVALDIDSPQNSRITYQFLQIPDATLFSLDRFNGEIRTMRMFSYKDPRHLRLVVVAKDNGNPALSATVTIKLSTAEQVVKAIPESTQVPLEYDVFSEVNLYLVIGLGSVSFLLLITILVSIIVKCQKPKTTKAHAVPPACRNTFIPPRNPNITDSTLISNDAYWYSLFLAETRKGKVVIRQPIPKGAGYIVSSMPQSTGQTETSESTASTLQYSE